jgi:ATP-dependent DNA ligase
MAPRSKFPKPLQPMLATLTDAAFDDPDWVFETKWDGFRIVLIVGRILHDWDLAQKRMLLEKAHAALPKGGALIA